MTGEAAGAVAALAVANRGAVRDVAYETLRASLARTGAILSGPPATERRIGA